MNSLVIKKFKLKIFLLVFLLIVGNILEIAGIGSIPIFVSQITNPDKVFFDLNLPKLFAIDLEEDQKYFLIIMIVIVALIFFLKNIFLIITIYFQGLIRKSMKKNLVNSIYEKYIYKDYNFYLKKNPEVIIRTLTSDVEQAMVYVMAIINLLKELILLSFIITLLFIVNVKMTITIVILLISFVGIYLFVTKSRLAKSGKIYHETQSKFLQIINKSFYGIREIKLFSKEDFFLKIFNFDLEKIEKQRLIIYLANMFPKYFLEFFGVLFMLIFCFIFIYTDRNLNEVIPLLTLLAMCSLKLIPSFNAIAQSISGIKFNQKAFQYIENELEENIDFVKKSKKIKFKSVLLEKIKFEDVSFQYKNDEIILDKINLEIIKKDKLAISGDSGSGKSTLLNLVLGLLKPNEGKIKINEKDLSTSLDEWQSSIGYIPQEIFLFDDTIKSNITYIAEEEKIDNELLEEVLKKSQLWDFVQSLENGINTKVGDRAINLSGGQKQRIAIARALYRNSNILIMDEPTSSLDEETETAIINDIFNIFEDKTVILVSHNKRIFEKCNKIFEIKKNRISQLK